MAILRWGIHSLDLQVDSAPRTETGLAHLRALLDPRMATGPAHHRVVLVRGTVNKWEILSSDLNKEALVPRMVARGHLLVDLVSKELPEARSDKVRVNLEELDPRANSEPEIAPSVAALACNRPPVVVFLAARTNLVPPE